MRVLFILDPLESLNLATETSLLLIEELARRGHESLVAGVPDLYLTECGAGARARSIALDFSREPFFRLGAEQQCPFIDFDLVMMRKDPPVDATFIAATYVLERAAADVPVINNPVSLRSLNEKVLPLRFPEFAPPTWVTADAGLMEAFAFAHGRVVMKPLEDCSGRGIRIVEPGRSEDAAAFVAAHDGRFVMAQKFIDEVAAGDKRIFLLAGEAIGTVNRVPRSRGELANIHQGARVEAASLTERDRAIVDAVTPFLLAHGIWLAGLDVIGGYLTEINITSPSAARQINAVSGARIEAPIVDFMERFAAEHAPVRRE